MKIIHTGDWHVSRERAEEKFRTITNIINFGNKEKVDLMAVCGDIFDRKPQACDINMLTKILQEANFPIVLLWGNHDPEAQLDIYEHIKGTNITVINKITTEPVTVAGINILAIPHITKHNIDSNTVSESISVISSSLSTVLNHWQSVVKDSKLPIIVLGHFSVDSALMANGQMIQGKSLIINSLELEALGCPVMLGHIHKYQGEGNVIYSGNQCRTKFDETDEKGFVLWQFNDELTAKKWSKQFYSTAAKQLLSFTGKWDGDWQVNEDIVDVEGKEIKYSYNITKEQLGLADEKQLSNIFKGAASIKVDRRVITTLSQRSKEISQSQTLSDKLKVFQQLNGKPDFNDLIFNKLEAIELEIQKEMVNG